MAKTNHTKAFIRKGEIFFLNGALIRAHDSFGMEIMLSDTFLLPSQIVSEESSKSKLQKAYYFIQQMMIEPNKKDEWQQNLDEILSSLQPDIQKKIWKVLQENNIQKVLYFIRSEIQKKTCLLN